MRARTTIRLDAHLLKDAKRYALERNKTLTALIEEVLRNKLEGKSQTSEEPFVLVTSAGGPKPGVDLSNNSLVQDIMDGLMQEVKRYAAECNQTPTSVIEEALREKIMKRPKAKRREPFKLTPFSREGKGLKPGVDLDSNAALLDLMEDR